MAISFRVPALAIATLLATTSLAAAETGKPKLPDTTETKDAVVVSLSKANSSSSSSSNSSSNSNTNSSSNSSTNSSTNSSSSSSAISSSGSSSSSDSSDSSSSSDSSDSSDSSSSSDSSDSSSSSDSSDDRARTNIDANVGAAVPGIGGDVALDRSGVRAVQAALNRLGFGAGAADGVMGPATRAAIQRFQASIGTRQTGELTADELRLLF